MIQNSEFQKKIQGIVNIFYMLPFLSLHRHLLSRHPVQHYSPRRQQILVFFQRDSMYLCTHTYLRAHTHTYTHTERQHDSLHFLYTNGSILSPLFSLADYNNDGIILEITLYLNMKNFLLCFSLMTVQYFTVWR